MGLRVMWIVLAGALAVLVANTPANRDGMAGQLATANEQTQSAARSAALAVQLWAAGDSTNHLVAVQLSDARQAVVRSYQEIADLQADNPDDARRQQVLTTGMTEIVNDLNEVSQSIRGAAPHRNPGELPARLLDRLAQLDRQYG
jgi:hypothetical protein